LAGTSPLRFSLAHAGNRAVLAVAWEREVGIDLEPLDAGLDLSPLLASVCTAAEAARIAALPPAKREEAFLTLWTLKEAYLKATGTGFSRDPRDIEVRLSEDRAAVHDPIQGEHDRGWGLRVLDAGAGWVAALAAAGSDPAISAFRWIVRSAS
jgi:4'-phosphopantetheinyl transferase